MFSLNKEILPHLPSISLEITAVRWTRESTLLPAY